MSHENGVIIFQTCQKLENLKKKNMLRIKNKIKLGFSIDKYIYYDCRKLVVSWWGMDYYFNNEKFRLVP